ncbi:hypothetical protein LLH00_11855 [bacterium]|nr:hypothetical protein [bacterium]
MKTSLLILATLTAILLAACGNGNPVAPQQPQPEATEIDTSGPWVAAPLPSGLEGEWLYEGASLLTIAPDSVTIYRGSASTHYFAYRYAVAECSSHGSQLRLLLRESVGQTAPRYALLYLLPLDGSALKAVWTITSAGSVEEAAGLWLDESRRLLLRGTWVQDKGVSIPDGNWVSDDYSLDISLNGSRIAINGKEWEIAGIETDYTEQRLILKSNGAYCCIHLFYYSYNHHQVSQSLGTAASAEEARALKQGELVYIYQYVDFYEVMPLKAGALWRYDFSYSDYGRSEPYPISYYSYNYARHGSVELRVLSAADGPVSGSRIFELVETFWISGQTKHVVSINYMDPEAEKLDTTYIYADTTIVRTCRLEVGPEQVWLQLDGKKVLFDQRKHRSGEMFAYNIFFCPDLRAFNREDMYIPDISFLFSSGQGLSYYRARDSYGGIDGGYDTQYELSLKEFTPGE